MPKLSILVAALACWIAGSAAAQDPAGEEDQEPGVEVSDSTVADAETAPERPRRRRGRSPSWRLDASVAGIYDSNIGNNQDGVESSGGVLELGIRYNNHRSYPTLVIDYEVASHSYTNTETWDRISLRALASYIRRFDDNRWRWETMAWGHLGGVTVFDRELVDQYLLLSRLDYRLSSDDRLRVYGAFRRKVYRTTTAGDADNPYVGTEFRRQFSRGHTIELGYRFEVNDAERARRDYRRSTLGLEYDLPLGRRDALSLDLFYRRQTYPDRLVDQGTGMQPRLEHRWSPRAAWQHDFSRGWTLQTEYRYDQRFSNDPRRE